MSHRRDIGTALPLSMERLLCMEVAFLGPWIYTLPPTVVDVFEPATERWDQITTTGPPPPGFISASCAVIGIYLYVFSGQNGIAYFNNIHQLNTRSLEWTKLDDANQGEAPMAKSGAAMVSYNERMLITIGGYGILPYHRRPGTDYYLDPNYPGRGYTNELLCFNLDSRTWSSPHTTGTPPPASAGHSFTMVDLHRAVLFGGEHLIHLLPNHVYILDVQLWMWTTIAGGGPGWPVHRAYHSAVSLHHSDGELTPDPALMVMWGEGPSNVILSDSWVFQVNVRQWRKVTLPDTLKGRFGHSTTIVHTGSTLKKLVTYGGLDEFPRNTRDSSTYNPVAETTVVDIESFVDIWLVTDVRRLGRRSVPSRPLMVPPALQFQPPALLTPWLAPGLLTEHPAAMLPQPAFTAPTLRPYFGAGIQEMQPEHRPFIPPVEAPPLPDVSHLHDYDDYPITSIPPIPYDILPLMSSATTHQVEALPVAAPFPQPTSDSGSQAAVQAMDSAILPQTTPTSYSTAPPQEPPSSDQESVSTIADIKPKVEPPSPKDEKPTLFKIEPASPIKKEIKSEQVKPLSDSEQDEYLEVAHLREIVAHQMKQIVEYQEMYEKPLQEEQTPPTCTSEQAVQTNTSDVTTTGYLRGFESFAETSFVITGTHSHSFEWQGYGLKLHIPEGAVPADHSECRIDIKVGLSGQFTFPDDSRLVSCVYWICCSHKFLKAVTLEIEHCSSVQHSSQCSNLHFVAARCSQEELPYHFKELKQATFSPQTSFGSVQVSQFSFFGIIRKISSFFRSEEPRCYCGNLYYMNKGLNDWQVDFVVMWNLSGYCKAVESVYAGHTSDNHLRMTVEFQEDRVTLAVPVDGVDLKNGWEITPLTPPTIRKSTVDNFRPGQQLPSCCLSVEWTREDRPIKLKHRIFLVGATEPFNFFYLKLIPDVLLTESLKQHSQKRRRKQQEDHHNGKSKREKLSIKPEIHTDIPETVSPSSSEDAATPMAEEVDKLDQDNHIEITGYLLGLDKTHVYHLGLVLGLSEPRVREMEDSKTFLDDMVVAWLQKVDQVQKRGAPSWRRLVEALRDRRVGQNGIARKILQDRILKQN